MGGVSQHALGQCVCDSKFRLFLLNIATDVICYSYTIFSDTVLHTNLLIQCSTQFTITVVNKHFDTISEVMFLVSGLPSFVCSLSGGLRIINSILPVVKWCMSCYKI